MAETGENGEKIFSDLQVKSRTMDLTNLQKRKKIADSFGTQLATVYEYSLPSPQHMDQKWAWSIRKVVFASKKSFFALGLGILKASSIDTCSLILSLVLHNSKLEQLRGDLFFLVFYLIYC